MGAIPGLESFMNSGSYYSSFSSGNELYDLARMESDLNEAAADSAEDTAESEEDEKNASQVTDFFRRLAAADDYVRKYGVDRSFAFLCNYDGQFNHGLSFAGYESFDMQGNPYSSESVACLEDMKESWDKFVTFLKNLWEKFKNWALRQVTKFTNLFRGKYKPDDLRKAIDKCPVNGDKFNFGEGVEDVHVPDVIKVGDELLSVYKDIEGWKTTVQDIGNQKGKINADTIEKDFINSMNKIRNIKGMFNDARVALSSIGKKELLAWVDKGVAIQSAGSQLNTNVSMIIKNGTGVVNKLMDDAKKIEDSDAKKESVNEVKALQTYIGHTQSLINQIATYSFTVLSKITGAVHQVAKMTKKFDKKNSANPTLP